MSDTSAPKAVGRLSSGGKSKVRVPVTHPLPPVVDDGRQDLSEGVPAWIIERGVTFCAHCEVEWTEE